MTIPVLTDADRAIFADTRGGRPRTAPCDADPALAGFRELLKRHREARRWSQEDCAAECEMDHSLVSRLESGQRRPTRNAIGKLARGLELTPAQFDDLLMSAGYLPAVAVDEMRAAMAYLRETTTAEREAALALIRAARRV